MKFLNFFLLYFEKHLFESGLRIRIHFIRNRIQHFRPNTDPDLDPIRIQGFNDQKLQLKKMKFLLHQKLQFTIPKPPKRTYKLQKKPSALKRENPSLQNMKFFNFFLLLWVIFALPNLDPNSESAETRIQLGSGSATLLLIR
jgi:hypothetical protein